MLNYTPTFGKLCSQNQTIIFISNGVILLIIKLIVYSVKCGWQHENLTRCLFFFLKADDWGVLFHTHQYYDDDFCFLNIFWKFFLNIKLFVTKHWLSCLQNWGCLSQFCVSNQLMSCPQCAIISKKLFVTKNIDWLVYISWGCLSQ